MKDKRDRTFLRYVFAKNHKKIIDEVIAQIKRCNCYGSTVQYRLKSVLCNNFCYCKLFVHLQNLIYSNDLTLVVHSSFTADYVLLCFNIIAVLLVS